MFDGKKANTTDIKYIKIQNEILTIKSDLLDF